MKLLYIVFLTALVGCASTKDPYRKHVRLLQKGKITEDTSVVYQLPFEDGKSYRMIQGYFSAFSHKNRAAIDFRMKRGSKICAARGGVVIRVKEDGDKGGWNRKYRPFGNNIVIQHPDGTRAGYWHLQKDGALVNIGDTVKAGQVIALSGKTGYAAVPHLHFMVWASGGVQWQQVPTRFFTASGPKYLKPWKKYQKPATTSSPLTAN
ncbi:MAG: M23 family metallopeptidase [Chitinophagaceae bacterium]|nr:M23 family metallopeptidase [Chitinophagaceae bacterium]